METAITPEQIEGEVMNVDKSVQQILLASLAAIAVGAALPPRAAAANAGSQASASQAAADGASGAQGDVLKEVVVTGSRLSQSFVAPTPITSLSSAQLALKSPNDIAAALAQTPSLSSTVLSGEGGSGSGSEGTNGQSLLDLRGLGINRTLVLLDGQRLGTTNVQDSVDINIIPQNLVKRVDVVTGGASATYGSDAVAGVVNFVLDTTFQGFKADVNAGTTTYGDATNGSVSVAYGTKFGDHVRLITSASLFKQGGVGLAPTGRSWDDSPWGAYANSSGSGAATLVVPNVRSSAGAYGGVITKVQGCTSASCQALVGQQFGPAGALEPFQRGANPGPNFASGGDGARVTNGISPGEDRESAFAHLEWDISPDLTLFTEGLFSRTATSLAAQTLKSSGPYAFTIYRGNAYLPAPVTSAFASNPSMTSFTMGWYGSGPANTVYVNTLDQVGRFSVGAKGAINDDWSFDTSLAEQYTIDNLDMRDTINRNTYAAADAVVDPSTGNIVCRSTLSGLDPGCQPADLFGPNSISRAAYDYMTGDNRGDTVFRQTAFEANVRGDLGHKLNFGAGRINVAMGVAYHHDIADRTVDPLSDIHTSCAGLRGCPKQYDGRYGGYTFYNPSPLYGWTSATEGYAELGVPLLRDLPLVKSLNADLAGRMTDYNISGAQDSWKLGLRWALNRSVMVRATDSQDIRAPDVLELFNSASTTVAQDRFPYSTAPSQATVTGINLTEGNPKLQPEIAHTVTGGIVLSPTWMPGLVASVDYYHIAIADAIENTSVSSIIDGCYQGNQAFCKLVTVNGTPVTTTTGITAATTGLVVTAPTENVGDESTSGIDLETTYRHRAGPGTLSVRGVANHLLTENLTTANTGCPVVEVAGFIGGCLNGFGPGGLPRWTGSLSLQYQTQRYSAYVEERIIGSGKADPYDVVGVDISRDMSVPTVEYTNLALAYTLGFGGRGQLYLNVTNLFNREPPVTATTSTSWVNPTSFRLYDVLGRRFLLGYKLSL
ncbi:MAG: TonB-dependent receptor domain-containing protein [Acetobacteraceae bacterium]